MTNKLRIKSWQASLFYFAASIAMFFFYYSGPPIVKILTPLIILVPMYFIANEDKADLPIRFLIFFSVLMLALRLYKLTTCPLNFYWDEFTDIYNTFMKMTGKTGLLEYSKRSGAGYPLLNEAALASVMAIAKTNIGFTRIVPAVMSLFTAFGVYCLASELKGKNFGATALFIYSTSGWAFITSRTILANAFLPAFSVWMLYFLLKYAGTKKTFYAISSLIIFALGFFSHSAWTITALIVLYVLFEKRKEISRSVPWLIGLYMLIFLIALCSYFFINNLIDWVMKQSVFSLKGGGLSGINLFEKIVSLFFLQNLLPEGSEISLPVLSVTEWIFVLTGTVFSAINFKNKETRMIFIIFLLSMFSLAVSSNVAHIYRHMMMIPFISIISATGLVALAERKSAAIFIAMHACVFTGIVITAFALWGGVLTQVDTADIEIAGYVDAQGPGALFIHDTLYPYGDYPAFLRTRCAYNQVKNPDKVFLLSYCFIKKYIDRVLPGGKTKYFIDKSGSGRFPMALFEWDMGENSNNKDFFMKLNTDLEKISKDLWVLDYSKAADEAIGNIDKNAKDSRTKLFNTFMVYPAVEAYMRQGMTKQAFGFVFGKEKPFYITADQYYAAGKVMVAQGYKDNALSYLEKASKEFPGWQAPVLLIDRIKSGKFKQEGNSWKNQ